MDKIKVVLVGIGGYGGTFLQDFIENPKDDVEVAGLVDPYPERSGKMDEIKERNWEIFSSMEDFYAVKKADLAVIATPIFLHTKNILTALENGSNAICEKPLCGDIRDAEIIKAASEKAGKFVYIGYQWAYSRAVTALKNDIIAGKFGKVQEMKSLVLRPRNRAYFGRGVGWAGKITAPDGSLVYDSIANNSAAHYLFDMLYVTGDYGMASQPTEVKGELIRANNIENFDTCKIEMTLESGAKALFIGAHPIENEIGPLYEYTFEKGKAYFAVANWGETSRLLHKDYNEFGNIVAFMNDGEKIVYGDPNQDVCKKIHIAIDAIRNGIEGDGICGVDAASAHTRVINTIQQNCKIYEAKKSLIKEKNDIVYVDGLYDALVDIYRNDSGKSILPFAEM